MWEVVDARERVQCVDLDDDTAVESKKFGRERDIPVEKLPFASETGAHSYFTSRLSWLTQCLRGSTTAPMLTVFS